MTGYDIFSLVAAAGIFLAVFIPLLMGLIYYIRENRRLDREEREKTAGGWFPLNLNFSRRRL